MQFFFVAVVGLNPFRSAQTIAGLWDVAKGALTMVLGEMDVDRVKPP